MFIFSNHLFPLSLVIISPIVNTIKYNTKATNEIKGYLALNGWKFKEVINEILQKHNNVYVISLKGPNDQKYFNGLVNYSCLYEYTPNSIRTVVRQLKQQMNLNGKLPK